MSGPRIDRSDPAQRQAEDRIDGQAQQKLAEVQRIVDESKTACQLGSTIARYFGKKFQ